MKWMSFFVFLFSVLIWNTSWSQSRTVDIDTFIRKQKQTLQRERQKYQSTIQRMRENLRKEREKALADFAEKEDPEELLDTIPVARCDCDDPGDPHNYATNFLYDAQKRKTYRINPYCKCFDPVSSTVSPTAPSSHIGIAPEKKEKGPQTYKWNIQY